MRKFLLAAACAALAAAGRPARAETAPSGDPAPNPSFKYDSALTSLADILAGCPPEPGHYENRITTDAWKNHSEKFSKMWALQKKGRFAAARKWRETEIPLPSTASTTLLYPFSGPDFMNAYLFFPDRRQYVFFSLEEVGDLPDLDKMSDGDFDTLISDVEEALAEVFSYSFFRTNSMKEQLQQPVLKGTKPLLFVFLALHECRIVSQEDVELTRDGRVVPRGISKVKVPVKGVKIVFRHPKRNFDQTLYYFSFDASNVFLSKHKEPLRFVKSLGRTVTFMKSASYLLQYDYFSLCRKGILGATDILMQDDSGVPYKYLADGTWDVKLYGAHDRPIELFDERYQEDLHDAYNAAPPPPALPFRFGYGDVNRRSNIQIAFRRKSSPETRTATP